MRKLTIALLGLTLCSSCEQNPYRMGERLYKTHCANCHMDAGEGLAGLIPPLSNADYLTANRDQLACLIRYGLKDTIMVNGKIYAEQMPGNDKLSDIQITNVVNYVLQKWSNAQPPVDFDTTKKRLEDCKR